MTLHTTARRAANLARLWPVLRHPELIALAYGIPAALMVRARQLAEAERAGLTLN
jgi:hypothetical protein